MSNRTFAEYDLNKLGEAIGQFVSNAWVIDRLNKTECSYLFKETGQFQKAYDYSKTLVKKKERPILFQAFFAKEGSNYSKFELKMELWFRKKILKELEEYKKTVDVQSACGMIYSVVVSESNKAKEKLELTTIAYGLSSGEK